MRHAHPLNANNDWISPARASMLALVLVCSADVEALHSSLSFALVCASHQIWSLILFKIVGGFCEAVLRTIHNGTKQHTTGSTLQRRTGASNGAGGHKSNCKFEFCVSYKTMNTWTLVLLTGGGLSDAAIRTIHNGKTYLGTSDRGKQSRYRSHHECIRASVAIASSNCANPSTIARSNCALPTSYVATLLVARCLNTSVAD